MDHVVGTANLTGENLLFRPPLASVSRGRVYACFVRLCHWFAVHLSCLVVCFGSALPVACVLKRASCSVSFCFPATNDPTSVAGICCLESAPAARETVEIVVSRFDAHCSVRSVACSRARFARCCCSSLVFGVPLMNCSLARFLPAAIIR
jgi:hypothetical protein